MEGNFLNGLYEQEHVRYGEWNFGFPTESQTILNVPNCKTIRLAVDGEPMDIRTGTLQNYRRTLDMNRGQVVRSFEWTAPNGKNGTGGKYPLCQPCTQKTAWHSATALPP